MYAQEPKRVVKLTVRVESALSRMYDSYLKLKEIYTYSQQNHTSPLREDVYSTGNRLEQNNAQRLTLF